MPTIAVGGIEYFYRQVGSGPRTVAFLHGFCQSSLWWEPTLQALPQGWQGLALDLKGFGGSSKPAGTYGVPVAADELRAVLDSLGLERVALVGGSMGGAVAQCFACLYAGRLHGLALVASGPYQRDPAAGRARAERFADMPWTRENLAGIIAPFFVSLPAGFERLVDEALRAGREALVQLTLSLASLNLLPSLRGVSVPTLIVQGAQDSIRPPAEGRLMHEAIAGSELHIVENASHTPAWEQPEAFRPLLWRFLETLP
ncbi:MAG: alpha/beta hydrolase [Chloroflexi bacterium]|nr:alpha/beta hydrolase [Chloroflexota bacterium]MCL5108063.1 alpha/beta hydrolase [Chloroflexota bacterium]